MAILVTRPQPDNARTAAALRVQGYVALAAPMLRFEKVMFSLDVEADFGAVIVTSANALRGLADQPAASSLFRLPVFSVGDRTAQAATPMTCARCSQPARRPSNRCSISPGPTSPAISPPSSALAVFRSSRTPPIVWRRSPTCPMT